MLRRIGNLLAAGSLVALCGCGSHYAVRDPQSGSTYYTTDVERTGDSGAVKFKDDATGSKVIIQQSEIKKISEDDYESGVKGNK